MTPPSPARVSRLPPLSPALPAPNAPYTQPSVRVRSINRWISSCLLFSPFLLLFLYVVPKSHVTTSLVFLQDLEVCGTPHLPNSLTHPPQGPQRSLAKFSPSVSGTAVRNRAHNGINAGARATRETPAVNGQRRQWAPAAPRLATHEVQRPLIMPRYLL